jgi:hypothetical protein
VLAATLVGSAPRALGTTVTVSKVQASACGYFVNVGLFGGPQALRGCGQGVTSSSPSYSPNPTLPPNGAGSSTEFVEQNPNGASATYGPATIFGGRWPENVQSSPASGPLTAKVKGTPSGVNVGGAVTSSATIDLFATPKEVTCSSKFSRATRRR